jgi:ABC-type multidrug transport system fused ATPase/permease subunit
VTVVRKVFDLLSRRDQLWFLLLLAVLIVVATLEMAGIASILPFMAIVTNPESIHTNQWLARVYDGLGFRNDEAFLTFVGAVVLGLLIVSNMSKAFSTWLTLRYHNKLAHTFSRRLLANYMARPYTFFLGRNTSEMGSTILTEANRVVSGVISPLTDIISYSLVSAAIFVLLIIVDPWVALTIASVLGGSYFAVYLLARRKLGVISKQQAEANARKYKYADEALDGIKDLKILGRELTFLNRFAFFARRHATNNVTAGVIAQLPRYALEIIAFGGILVMVLFLISRGQKAAEMVPLLALYAFAGYRLLPSLQALFSAITNLRFNVGALHVVHDDLAGNTGAAVEPERYLEEVTKAQPMSFKRAVELKNVSFQYEGSAERALRNLNLTIEANTVVGLVGPTGCGKTTTVDLILGLLSPTEGQLLVDGVEINDQNRASWQRILGYVPQQIYISDDSVARNIAFGVPDDQIDMDAVRKAAEIANLAEFIETRLPEGYDTRIGERGVRLSGGQRQRIGIARALYRDPAILVLDEATSALDGITEEYVMNAVHKLSKKKTIILIAHRLTTVKECDVIYQLERGSVVASGSYDDLMRNSSWFRAAARGAA